MLINEAVAEDIPALCDLLAELFAQESEFEPDRHAQHRGLTHIIAHPEVGMVLVAHKHRRAVGMVSLLYTFSTALGEPVCWLEDLVVAQQFRGQGIGSRLLEQAILAAESRGCKRITLLTDQSNHRARKFYASHHFTVSTMLPMRLRLDQKWV